jgi:hypothetical protein
VVILVFLHGFVNIPGDRDHVDDSHGLIGQRSPGSWEHNVLNTGSISGGTQTEAKGVEDSVDEVSLGLSHGVENAAEEAKLGIKEHGEEGGDQLGDDDGSEHGDKQGEELGNEGTRADHRMTLGRGTVNSSNESQ